MPRTEGWYKPLLDQQRTNLITEVWWLSLLFSPVVSNGLVNKIKTCYICTYRGVQIFKLKFIKNLERINGLVRPCFVPLKLLSTVSPPTTNLIVKDGVPIHHRKAATCVLARYNSKVEIPVLRRSVPKGLREVCLSPMLVMETEKCYWSISNLGVLSAGKVTKQKLSLI